MAMPMLPGYNFPDPTKKDFKKTQHFGFKNGLVINNIKPALAQLDPDEIVNLPPITLLGPMGASRDKARQKAKLDPYTPSDMKYYKKVLCFNAYWKETVGHQKLDRGADIQYFLEDDTIQIVEPKQINSGIQQGTILSRQAIPFDSSLSASAPFQTTLNAPPSLEETLSPPNRTVRTPPSMDTFNRSVRGGVRDPNNYLSSLSLNDSPAGTADVTARPSPPASPGLTATRSATPASPSATASRTVSTALNGTRTSPKGKTRSRAGPTFHWTDLSVGIDVVFFGRNYHIADADHFTREFFHSQGIELLPAEPLPENLTAVPETKNTRLLSHDAKSPEERYRLRKFLEHDRKVLRFYCIWDDSATVYGDRRPFLLHYFLVDDTVELREVLGVNSGRDPSSSFMKKQRLPKKPTSLSELNSKNTEFYTDADLRIGETINVFGRKFLLYDADPFTRTYYEDMYGITEFPVLQVEEEVRQAIAREIPEHNGFGSEEDSLANCLSLVPKPPKKFFKDSPHTPNEVLRFTAQMEDGKKGDEERRFVVSFFMEDDTFSVFETPLRGIRGGKFLERRKLKNPRTNAPYQAFDFFVGALLDVNAHKFRLIEADSFATQFIQEHEQDYAEVTASRTVEDVKNAVSKLRPGALRKNVPTGQLSHAAFKQALTKAGLTIDNASFSNICAIFSAGGDEVDTGLFLQTMESNGN